MKSNNNLTLIIQKELFENNVFSNDENFIYFMDKKFDFLNLITNNNKQLNKKFLVEELITGENKNIFKFITLENLNNKDYLIDNDINFIYLNNLINVN